MTCADCEDTFTDTYEELQEQLDATEDHRDVLLATLDAERAKSAELLAALVYLVDFCAAGGSPDDEDLQPARAVIAHATGGEP